jgi:DNA polymerase-4
MAPRTILHLRVDSLLAALQAREQPLLVGQPFVVASSAPSAQVLDVSPGAQRLGIAPGMALWRARALRPEIVVVPPDHARHEEAFGRVLDVCLRFTPQVRAWGRSEVFLDISGSLRLFGGRDRLAEQLRGDLEAEMEEDLGVAPTVTAGLGPNPLLARIATQVTARGTTGELFPENPRALAPLPVALLWIVDMSVRQRLVQMGVGTFGQLQMIPSVLLRREFGEAGPLLFDAARGRDETPIPVCEEADAAFTVRHVLELPGPTHDPEGLRLAGLALAQRVGASLRVRRQAATTLQLTVTLRNRRRITRRRNIAPPTDEERRLVKLTTEMLRGVHTRAQPAVEVALAAGGLVAQTGARQLSLFDDEHRKGTALVGAKDRLAARGREVVSGSLTPQG